MRDVGLDARVHGEFHRGEFRRHPAHREAAFVLADVAVNLVDVGHLGDELLGFRIEQAIDAGEQDDALGPGEFRDADREHVVVAEFQFLDRDRVVFVDDR